MNADVRLRDAGGGIRTRVGCFTPGSFGLSDPTVGMFLAGIPLYDGPNYNRYFISAITTQYEEDEPPPSREQEVELIPDAAGGAARLFRLVLTPNLR